MVKNYNIYDEFGFVHVCKCLGVIDFKEIIEWMYYKIKINDNLPTFFYEGVTASTLNELFKIIGKEYYLKFHSGLNSSEQRGTCGIGYKRGFYSKENPCELCTEKTALKNLEKNPHILERFKETFPFIKLDWAD